MTGHDVEYESYDSPDPEICLRDPIFICDCSTGTHCKDPPVDRNYRSEMC